MAGEGVSRRDLLRRAGWFGAALALIDLGAILDQHGLVEQAAAQSADLTHDTLSALVAFVLPGDDAYSVAQGERADGPGGIAAGGVETLIVSLDHYVPVSTVATGPVPLPASGGIAALLNQYALRVNPTATRGGFPSAFARLSFAEKARVFELFESEPSGEGTELRFVAGILPGFATFVSMSEAGSIDPATRALTRRPFGWDLTGYGGPAEGHRELRGYWRGHRSAIGSKRRRRRRRRR